MFDQSRCTEIDRTTNTTNQDISIEGVARSSDGSVLIAGLIENGSTRELIRINDYEFRIASRVFIASFSSTGELQWAQDAFSSVGTSTSSSDIPRSYTSVDIAIDSQGQIIVSRTGYGPNIVSKRDRLGNILWEREILTPSYQTSSIPSSSYDLSVGGLAIRSDDSLVAVSYTHLTLPTICSV